jgi:glucosamine--fructose-6-phosphate aminotransferase (isomerizing)
VRLGGLLRVKDRLRSTRKIIILSCGTSYYAGLIGKMMLEEYAGIETDVEYASEFRYRTTLLDESMAVLAITQSGETADTLAAVEEAKNRGALTLGIVNVVGSTIARTVDAGIYNHIGPEIGVASTKAFTSQLATLAVFAVFVGRQRSLSKVMEERIVKELLALPGHVQKILDQAADIEVVAKEYTDTLNMMYLGRKYNYPIAYEGALKLKEISYIHAEGYPTGEMKHGPIALVDQNFPCVCIAPKDSVYEKNKSGIEELKARGAKIIAVTTDGNTEMSGLADHVLFIPKTLEMLTPILSVVPLQLFAYYISRDKGLDVDKPRNLAKSVTVE